MPAQIFSVMPQFKKDLPYKERLNQLNLQYKV